MVNNFATSYNGLTTTEIIELQKIHGANKLQLKRTHWAINFLRNIAKEPMILMLLAACTIYFLLGESTEGVLMISAIILVGLIAFFQERKSNKAIKALKEYTTPKITAIRNGQELLINSVDLVPADIIVLSEGDKVPADAIVLQENDLSLNEAIITGEAFPAEKDTAEKNKLYMGTTVNSGRCIAKVTETGNNTLIGKMGKSINEDAPKTLLQIQVAKLTKRLAFFGLGALLLILLINYVKSGNMSQSILLGLTIAMSAIPEEIPVALASFMALAALELSKMGIISRNPQVIEDLGHVDVLCMDKTGTITENKMEVTTIYNYKNDTVKSIDATTKTDDEVIQYAVMASEPTPFDALEKALWECYTDNTTILPLMPELIFEYRLEGKPPMMTHVYRQGNKAVATCKGAPERILSVCQLDEEANNKVAAYLKLFTSTGHKVIGIASAIHTAIGFPLKQDDFQWRFEGLIALFDPPKEGVASIIEELYNYNIKILLLTGDHPQTSMAVANMIGMHTTDRYLQGVDVMALDDLAIQDAIGSTNIFVRMFPEAKQKVINALKNKGMTVAMIGDGVNDGSAIKSANIGIAVGEKGTDVARLAADLVLTKDALKNIAEALRYGRKVNINLKKAIRYIIAIHIPIILTASLPLIFNWKYPTIFSPVHIIFLELIMGPTCSIFYEREPLEQNMSYLASRKISNSLFNGEELIITIAQGLSITIGVMFTYYYVSLNSSLAAVRTTVFIELLLCNLFLTYTNRSFIANIWQTVKYKNKLAPYVAIISALFILLIYFVSPVQNIFGLSPMTTNQVLLCLSVSITTVFWFELYKVLKKRISRHA